MSSRAQNLSSQPTKVYDTPQGQELVLRILLNSKPFSITPHEYQLEGICKSLDGEDMIATMATGAGKTGFYCFLMLVICVIAQNSELALGGMRFPSNPCMLLVCPTKALEIDMV